MDEQRVQAYLELIQKLLSCPTGEENTILHAHSDLVDGGLLQMCEQVAHLMEENGDAQNAGWLRNFARNLSSAMGQAQPNNPESQKQFLMQVLQTISEINGDPQVVYPLFIANLDLLNVGLIPIQNAGFRGTLAQADRSQQESIAAVVVTFGT